MLAMFQCPAILGLYIGSLPTYTNSMLCSIISYSYFVTQCALFEESYIFQSTFCLVLISYSTWWYSVPSDITLGRSLLLALEKRRASWVVWGSVPLKPLCLSRPVSESGQSDMLISLFVSVFRSITYVARYTRYQSAFEWCNHLSIITYW